ARLALSRSARVTARRLRLLAAEAEEQRQRGERHRLQAAGRLLAEQVAAVAAGTARALAQGRQLRQELQDVGDGAAATARHVAVLRARLSVPVDVPVDVPTGVPRLPRRDDPRRAQWLENSRRRDPAGGGRWDPSSKYIYFCSQHFEQSGYRWDLGGYRCSRTPPPRYFGDLSGVPSLFMLRLPPRAGSYIQSEHSYQVGSALLWKRRAEAALDALDKAQRQLQAGKRREQRLRLRLAELQRERRAGPEPRRSSKERPELLGDAAGGGGR
ncbi:LOW QUALITY PROTEIN: THAP domain-containing protein 7, partial [Pyrgilauda ruficollis]|uniref:LOW QUALITY PROTEIN: THAP domain-containing protein 7 n=1 Tax=Pyrgilauda ruficollis TaxID=221976 RepID=UPI001B882541